MLTVLDDQSLIEDALKGDLYSIIVMARAALDIGLEMAMCLLSDKRNDGSNPSFDKTPRAPRSKKKKKINILFYPLFFMSVDIIHKNIILHKRFSEINEKIFNHSHLHEKCMLAFY